MLLEQAFHWFRRSKKILKKMPFRFEISVLDAILCSYRSIMTICHCGRERG